MDPLSITASVLAIVGAAQQVTKGIAKLRALREAPAEFCSLMNEVSDLRAVLSQVVAVGNQIDEEQNEERFRGPIVALKSHLTRANDQLQALDEFVNSELIKIRDNGTSKLNRRAWAFSKRQISSMEKELQNTRVNIGIMLGAVTTSSMARVELKVVQIASEISDHQKEASTILADFLSQQCGMNAQHMDKANIIPDSLLFPSSSISRLRCNELMSSGSSGPQSHSPTLSIKGQVLASLCCKPWCSCVCHIRRNIRFPRALKTIVGTLFMGYSGLPVLTPACNELRCRRALSSSVSITYYFPSWLLARIINISASFNTTKGPALNLNIPRMVGWATPLWRSAHRDDIETMQLLFASGQASPFDVNAYGQSALHYASLSGNFKSCRFLIEQGADMHLEDENGRKPIDSAWDLALSNRLSAHDRDIVALIFNQRDYTEARQFHILHKIVLHIVAKPLQEELDGSTSGIDAVCANGRTSLSWAAARNDENMVKTLLEFGANLEITDFEGNTALAHAIKAANLSCVRLLLEYGADTTKRDAYGGTPIHHACAATNNPSLLELLIAAQVDVNAIDHDGDTALQYATRHKHLQSARCLLNSNADPEIANVEGETPLVMAINHKADLILRELIGRKINHRLLNSRRSNILHAVASEGSLDAMVALTEAQLTGMDLNARNIDNRTCQDEFEKREEKSEELCLAFRALCSSVVLNNAVNQFQDDSEDSRTHSTEEDSEEDGMVFEDATEYQV